MEAPQRAVLRCLAICWRSRNLPPVTESEYHMPSAQQAPSTGGAAAVIAQAATRLSHRAATKLASCDLHHCFIVQTQYLETMPGAAAAAPAEPRALYAASRSAAPTCSSCTGGCRRGVPPLRSRHSSWPACMPAGRTAAQHCARHQRGASECSMTGRCQGRPRRSLAFVQVVMPKHAAPLHAACSCST
jgi:hypothetical protein